jgi:glutathione S-transferase
MIEVYYWTTPNGHKITIFLEETGLPYAIKPVNIGKGEQFKPEFLAISPNNRIPAIVDNDPAGGGKPISIFESGAILQYLAEKTGKFLPADLRGRTEVMQWLFWQMGGLGPMLGQNHHFRNYSDEKLTYAIIATSRKPNVSTEYSTNASPIASSPPANIRLPIWLAIRGSSFMSGKVKISMIFRTSSAGSKPSSGAKQCNVPTHWQKPLTPRPLG